MKIKRSLLSALFLMGCISMSAQEQTTKTETVFAPHWYIQAQGGAQYTLGELSFSDLISPNFQVSGGYNFSPVVGARLGVNFYQSKAGLTTGGNEYDWKWKYVAPNVDLTFNLSNLVCGYKADRKFTVGAFAGLGLNIGFGNDDACDVKKSIPADYTDGALAYLWDGTKTRLQGRAGLTADYAISKVVSVGLELQATTLNDHFNSKRAGNSDWYFNGLVGLKFNLGKTHTTRTVNVPAPAERIVERVVERVVEKRCDEDCKKKCNATCEEKSEPLRRNVFFLISSTKISQDEMTKVNDIVEYMKANPKATVTVTGYADKGTGNKTINNRLAAQRAQIVYDTLIKKGIPASRITKDSKGDSVQPFAKPVENRVTICIAQ